MLYPHHIHDRSKCAFEPAGIFGWDFDEGAVCLSAVNIDTDVVEKSTFLEWGSCSTGDDVWGVVPVSAII